MSLLKKKHLSITLILLSLNLVSCDRINMWEKVQDSGRLAGYAVTYSGNGSDSGSVPEDGTRYLENGQVTVLGNTGGLVKSNCKFNGWALTPGSTSTDYTQGQIFTMGTADIVLYARWIADTVTTYTVTYDPNGASTGNVPEDNTEYTPGQTVYLPAQGSLANGTSPFCGWNTNLSTQLLSSNFLPGQTRTISGNTTFYAMWIPPVMISENFSSGTIDTDMFATEGQVTIPGGTGIVNISEEVIDGITTYGRIISREFRIPAIIEGVAAIYPSDDTVTQRRNSFIVARDEVYNSQNLPTAFSFDVLNLAANADIFTIVHLYGTAPLIDNDTGFRVYPVEGDLSSIQPRRFRIILYNNSQEFYIYDEDTSEWVMITQVTGNTLTSDVWWHFYMVSNETPDAYPDQLDSITIRSIQQSDETPAFP